MHAQKSDLQRDIDKLDKARVKLETRSEVIIRQQEAVISAADKGINQLNSDMKALKIRLKPYLKERYGRYDETYYDLKDRYQNKLAERAALERARVMAEESITAAKLHIIPGELG